MKKTVSIAIASTPFIIEEDAYQALELYLAETKAHFGSLPDATEVVADIEARVAEQLLESGKKIITHVEVKRVIAAMGHAKQFGSGVKSETHTENPTDEPGTKKKRLFRNPDDKVLAGVCSGVAAYIGTDVVWVRLAFVLLMFLNGLGIILYIALWLSMPEAKSASQRLEMSGTPVTIETIADRVKERVEEVKRDKGVFERIVSLPFTIIAGIFTFIVTRIFPLVGKIIGVIISIGGTIALFGLSIALGLLLTHMGGEYMDFPLQAVISPAMILIAGIAGYIALAVPFLFLLFFGNMLILRRSIISGTATLALLGVWFIAVVVGAVTGVSIGAKVASYVAVSPEYQDEALPLENIAPFTQIEAQNGVRVEYSQGATTSVTLLGRQKDLGHISVISQDGVLTIEPKRREGERFCLFCNFSVPAVVVTSPGVTLFSGKNGVRFDAENISSTSTVTVRLSNGAHGTFRVSGTPFTGEVQNGVHLEVSGTSTIATLTGENGARIDAGGLSADEATINISNAGEVEIGITKILSATARNGASIRYAGSPILTKDARNGAKIESVEE